MQSTGLRVSGVGSSQRSRNTVSTSCDGRPADRDLDVVPRRGARRTPWPSAGPAGRRGGRRRRGGCGTGRCRRRTRRRSSGRPRMADHDQLLVVRARRADPHVEQALAAGGLESRRRGAGSRPALKPKRRGASARPAPARRRRARRPRPRTCETSVPGSPASRSSASPRQSVNSTRSPARGRLEPLVQLGEVGRAVDQRAHPVARSTRPRSRGAVVEPGWSGCPARTA